MWNGKEGEVPTTPKTGTKAKSQQYTPEEGLVVRSRTRSIFPQPNTLESQAPATHTVTTTTVEQQALESTAPEAPAPAGQLIPSPPPLSNKN
jgi:hypothetical protein